MSDTTPAHHFSGGEMSADLQARYLKLRTLIQSEDDVHALLDLQPRPDGSWLYLIQTPFATWPKFVIGSTNDDNAYEILFRCGGEWSARAEWERIWNDEVEEDAS